jgi:excisionase family DNA binding protein
MEKIYTVEQVAENLCVHPSTIRRLIYAGRFPAAFSVGTKSKKWRIPESDVARFQEANRITVSTADPSRVGERVEQMQRAELDHLDL